MLCGTGWPALFGWRQITFWQALGLLALCRILFGGLAAMAVAVQISAGECRSDGSVCLPEERQKFRQGMGGGCGSFGTAPGASKEPA